MPNETLAPARQPPDAADLDDYQSLCAVLSTSARGRAFLAEFARRNRHADTEMLLAALERLEALVRADGSAVERLRDELRMLLIAIRLGRPEIDAASPLIKAAKLAGLLDLLERRIDAMAEAKPVDVAPPPDAIAAATPDAPSVDISRPVLSVVPPADEPELPIPSPASIQPPAIALVATITTMPEVTFVDSAPPAPAGVENNRPAPVALAGPAAIENNGLAPKATVAQSSADPLALIMALSEAERIALFT